MGVSVYDTDTSDFYEVLSAKELSDKVYKSINFYQERADKLAKVNKELMNDALSRANDQLKQENTRLKERLRLCIVELNSEKELEAYNAFEKEHERCRSFSKYFQTQLPYVIQSSSGIGMISRAKCPICGEEKDITDMEVW